MVSNWYPTHSLLAESPGDVPPAIPVWAKAVDNIDQRCANLNAQTPFMSNRYAYPNPYTFLGITSQRKAIYLAAWLASRAGWTHFVHTSYSAGGLPAATQTQWREWLASSTVVETQNPLAKVNGALLSTQDPGNGSQPVFIGSARRLDSEQTGKAPSKALRSKARREQAMELFNLWMPDVTFPERVYWKEKELQFGDSAAMTPAVTSEILWELFEHNWRFELLALDRTIHFQEWKDEQWGLERDAQLRAVFFGDGFLVGPVPLFDQGLAAECLKERLPYLRAFREVLKSWPGAVSEWPNVSLEMGQVNEGQALALEESMVRFYCQIFFNYIGRCPITPHRIPEPNVDTQFVTSIPHVDS
jgi:hypothetical protein